MNLVKPTHYNPFLIKGLQDMIFNFMDIKSICQLKETSKTLYSGINVKKLKYIKKNSINNLIINLIKSKNLNFINYNDNYHIIHFKVFTIILENIVQIKYTAYNLIALTDLLMFSHTYQNNKKWLKYFINYLNNNIDKIYYECKIETWNNILQLRSYAKSRPKIYYQPKLHKFIIPYNYYYA